MIRYSTNRQPGKKPTMFTAHPTLSNSRQAVSSRVRCVAMSMNWLNTELPTTAGTYFTGIKHPAVRPPEEPM